MRLIDPQKFNQSKKGSVLIGMYFESIKINQFDLVMLIFPFFFISIRIDILATHIDTIGIISIFFSF